MVERLQGLRREADRCHAPSHRAALVGEREVGTGTQGSTFVQRRVTLNRQRAAAVHQNVAGGLHAAALKVPDRGRAAGGHHALSAEIVQCRNHQVAGVENGDVTSAGLGRSLGHLRAQAVVCLTNGHTRTDAQGKCLDQCRTLGHGQARCRHQAHLSAVGVDACHGEGAARGQADLSIGARSAVSVDTGRGAHGQGVGGLQISRAASRLQGCGQRQDTLGQQTELTALGAQCGVEVQTALSACGLQQQIATPGTRSPAQC